MRLEGLLSGDGLPAGDALHSVPLSAPQPALADSHHGERYDPSRLNGSGGFSLACVGEPQLLLCVCRVPAQSLHLLVQSC